MNKDLTPTEIAGAPTSESGPAGDTDLYAAPAQWLSGGVGAQGNIFLTGRAGSGKSTLLKRILDAAGERAVVLAPTGIAAVNVGGQTIHSFFKFPPRLIEPGDIRRLRTTRLLKAVETLVVDEISMVRADMLDAIDRSLKLNRGSKRPFGGVRMILSGDLHQLPPVVRGEEHELLEERYGGAYFFNAPAFQEGEFSLLALKHMFRQSDPQFLALLGSIRQGRLTASDERLMADRVTGRSAIDASETHVVLTPNNNNAFRINVARLAALETRAKTFEAAVDGTFKENTFPTEADLELKEGARVMLIRNDPEGRWVNGTIGTVEGFGTRSVIVSIKGRPYEIEPVAWENYRYELDTKTNKVKRDVVGTFKQLPLRLAYAITIHKSQGMTLENVYIDFDRGMFAHGQAYVALSRAMSLEGLELSRQIRPRDLVIDRRAFQFGTLEKIEDTDAYLLAKLNSEDGRLV
ncbi:MAG: AAA family ATPase [Pseudomonadota bacterium]